ncbi:MAG TPA: O-antigen ligase family protein [Solirubrobacteraceae bacterium]|nr:O-antigen ligase family protein [Solirubrobacteraceae bacterium]
MTTPVAILTARRLAFYDVPFGYKGHRTPTPYLGGAAVTTAFVVALLLLFPASARSLALIGGVGVMFALGTIDDRRNVSPLARVIVEFLLGASLSALGHGWHLGAGRELDAVVNGIWIVAIVNAFNLFDNMDGAASTMAIVASAGTCILAWLIHDVWAATASAALCGACLGFLPHNLSKPAKIFLGDGGSMPLGFIVAVLTASAARRAEPSLLALLTGLLLVGVPALDTTLVIVSRRRRGISILTGGQDHLTHRTRRRMQTARRVALVLGSTQAAVSALVIVATRDGSVAVVYVALGFVICAATAIVGLENQVAATADARRDESGVGTLEPARAGGGASWPSRVTAAQLGRSRWLSGSAIALLAVVGLGAGLSPLFSAYYSATAWVPIGLGLVVAAAAAAIVRPPRMTLPVGLALIGIAGLGLWSLLSTTWAQAVEQAMVDANRWLAYAALLMLLLVLMRSRRRAVILLAAAGVGIAVVGATVLVRMLGSDPAQLFEGGRLNLPLGYINGEGCVFAMGCWFSLALAERRQPVLAGVGAAATVAMASLALLSQSRGAAIASFGAVLIALLMVPGIRRRTLALVVIAAGVVAASGPLLSVYSTGQTAVAASVAHSAAIAVIESAALAGVVWGLISALAPAIERGGERSASVLGRGATVLTILAIAVPVVVGIVRFRSIEHTASAQWHAFVNLSDSSAASSPSATQTRLLSGAGNRYDYWRVAWHVFESHPIVGVGAGNYTASYYRLRRTPEAIQNPHSIELQTLSELGVLGTLLLAMLVAGVVLGALKLRRIARTSALDRTLMVAATGAAVVWFVDTSGDWMHLLPGVTAIGLAGAAVLCRTHESVTPPAAYTRKVTLRALAGAAAVAFALVVSGASLLRSELVQRYLSSAQVALRRDPGSAIVNAQRALRLDGANLDAYYIEAAGQARFNRAASARSALLAAARQDPQDFVTWVLLGDLEVRLRDFAAAEHYYTRAHALDPTDQSVSRLAADPAGALASGSGK